jgi:type II secretory pathway component PulJ
LAAQQEMIRRMMQEYGQELKQGNAGNAKLAKEIDQMMKQMEQTENDLVNRVITQQTINRQQQIMTRMLEHEKAEMQREKEERRESHEGKEINHQPSASDLEQFKRMQEKNTELFRSVPPTLSPYYKTKVNDYFYKF